MRLKPLPQLQTILMLASALSSCRGVTVLDEERYACGTSSTCRAGFVCFDGECVSSSRVRDAGLMPPDAGQLDDGGLDGGELPPADAGVSCQQAGTCDAGSACTNSRECASGSCAGGACCASTCSGGCASCALPQALGLCVIADAGVACGLFRCTGASSVCPDQCTTSLECADQAGCCRDLANDPGFRTCRLGGMLNRCVSFPLIGGVTETFDVFDTNVWRTYGTTGNTTSFDNGQLVVRRVPGTMSFGTGLQTLGRFSLVDSGVSIELNDARSIRNIAFATGFFKLSPPASNASDYVGFDLNGNRLGAASINRRVTPRIEEFRDVPYDPSLMRYLRIRGTSNSVRFEYSSDGGFFTPLSTHTAPFPLTDLELSIGLFVDATRPESADGGAVVIFDNLNVLP